jgi:hypothetical protein
MEQATYKKNDTSQRATASRETSNKKTETTNKAEKWYSEDDLNNEIIEAYKNFEKKLREEIIKSLNEKLSVAKTICENIYHALNEAKDIKCKKIYLRTNSLISFEAIIVIPEKPYLSDAFTKAYEIAFEQTQGHQRNDFSFDFNFMPSTRHINASVLISDGFQLSFQPSK